MRRARPGVSLMRRITDFDERSADEEGAARQP